MYNFLEYSSNYSDSTFMILWHLWFYSKDEATNFNTDNVNTNAFKSFQYKTKLLGNSCSAAPNNKNGILKKGNNCVPWELHLSLKKFVMFDYTY